ncbi:hypothetical protein XA68_17467 [Ophiocordyceps unilateralis]|uniref:EKC/KEOPS complex subunit GON7 n=1 Tax=Ophiocordyceps unilateralis TaxID=268505 RepID=A0A2A9P371_OPHUN|nr:hypothetical protein XA68_17467 [Ophiocordyceps unilateralis]
MVRLAFAAVLAVAATTLAQSIPTQSIVSDVASSGATPQPSPEVPADKGDGAEIDQDDIAGNSTEPIEPEATPEEEATSLKKYAEELRKAGSQLMKQADEVEEFMNTLDAPGDANVKSDGAEGPDVGGEKDQPGAESEKPDNEKPGEENASGA